MLPGFGKAKGRANRDLLRFVRDQIPAVTPIIQGVATFRQHEGKVGKIVRDDDSESTIDYKPEGFEFTMTRAEMMRFDRQAIIDKLTDLAKKIGEAQTRRLLQVAGEAADSVGNVVHVGGELTPEKFLDVFRKVHIDFDPATGKPTPGMMFVMHPDLAESVVPKVKEWEEQPEFNAEYGRIMQAKYEEWRDREARRKLVS